MVLYYCDVHRTGKNGEGFRITYTLDGLTFRHAEGFGEIPAGAGDRVFIDTIPLQHTDGVIELLRRGVEIYYLRRLTLIARKREELKLSKTARNDVRTLMAIEQKWFKRVTEDFLVLRRMIVTYRSLMGTHQQFTNKYKAVSEEERRALRPVVKALEQQMERLAERIVEEAGRRFPVYNKLVEGLGIRDSPVAMEAVAELVVYIDLANSPLRGLKKLLGLYKPVRSRRKRHWRLYDGQLRQALNRLAMAYYGTKPNGRQCWMLARRIKELSTPQTQG